MRKILIRTRTYDIQLRRYVYSEYDKPAIFHQWGSVCHEADSGFGNMTVAIVEYEDGTIDTQEPEFVKFVEPTIIKDAA